VPCPVVFSKSYCPYCKATKSTLSSLDANYEVLELDQIGMRPIKLYPPLHAGQQRLTWTSFLSAAEGSALQEALKEINGQRTVPNIYIKQKHIGGNSDLQSLSQSGQLATLLKEAGAVAA
jgi:glutaredoxin 3